MHRSGMGLMKGIFQIVTVGKNDREMTWKLPRVFHVVISTWMGLSYPTKYPRGFHVGISTWMGLSYPTKYPRGFHVGISTWIPRGYIHVDGFIISHQISTWIPRVDFTWIPRDIHQFCLLGCHIGHDSQ